MSWPMTNEELRDEIKLQVRRASDIMAKVGFMAEETVLSKQTEAEIHMVQRRLDMILEFLRHD